MPNLTPITDYSNKARIVYHESFFPNEYITDIEEFNIKNFRFNVVDWLRKKVKVKQDSKALTTNRYKIWLKREENYMNRIFKKVFDKNLGHYTMINCQTINRLIFALSEIEINKNNFFNKHFSIKSFYTKKMKKERYYVISVGTPLLSYIQQKNLVNKKDMDVVREFFTETTENVRRKKKEINDLMEYCSEYYVKLNKKNN